MELFVHDTAFMIAYYRAQHEKVSRDPYAKLWLRPNLHEFTDEFAEKVSKHDELLHCLRNRYFHDQLQDFVARHKKLVLINLGAGFSMYPFSLPDHVISIDVDFKEIMSYKKNRIEQFCADGRLPKRDISFLSCDITSEIGQGELKAAIEPYSDHTKIILIEGVFFFLNQPQIDSIMRLSKDLLSKGDRLMCVSFDTSLKQTAVFNRLVQYFEEVLKSEHNPFTTIPHSYYQELDGFRHITQHSELELGKSLKVLDPHIQEKTVLNEYFYIVERK